MSQCHPDPRRVSGVSVKMAWALWGREGCSSLMSAAKKGVVASRRQHASVWGSSWGPGLLMRAAAASFPSAHPSPLTGPCTVHASSCMHCPALLGEGCECSWEWGQLGGLTSELVGKDTQLGEGSTWEGRGARNSLPAPRTWERPSIQDLFSESEAFKAF